MVNKIVAYTDGACSVNAGNGGWAVCLLKDIRTKFLSGGEASTTNNRMELTAVIEAIKWFNDWVEKGENRTKENCRLDIYSDSAYVVNAVKKGWLRKWKLNGFKKTDDTEVQNRDLWEELYKNLCGYHINVLKVKGHSGNEYNEMADKLARQKSLEFKAL